MTNESILVGDVGGTHARFAVVEVSGRDWQIAERLELDENRPAFADVVRECLDRLGADKAPQAASIAVAGPVSKGEVLFTNRGWKASESELVALGFKEALLINDFA